MMHLFQLLIYQPFFNLLVGLYWLLGFIPGVHPDMGIAVIIFTLIIRFLLLPISLASHRGEKDRKEIERQVKEIEAHYAHDPIEMRKAKKKIFKRNRAVVIGEFISLAIQVAIALMLWRIFATGLGGEDVHLLYSWMPEVSFPYNLNFLGKFDLTHPHWELNLLQSFLIFILETLSIYVSPYPVTKGEVVRLQLVLPLVSFMIFSQLPAGKKLFVIVTLSFSIVLTLIRAIVIKAREIEERLHKKDLEATQPQEEKVVVEVK